MSSPLQRELEILWSETDVDVVLEAHERLKAIATKEDLPILLGALKSEKNDFWTRELLAEPIAYLGGSDCLPDLFDAMERNYRDGHDNDSLAHFLTEIAGQEPAGCKAKLEGLMNSPDFPHRDYAKWLLEFCN
jgi:HEAT repeat protein